jgi:hypothetical protein
MSVEKIEFITDLEKRVALATVRIGEVVIRGVTVWRSSNGKLRVYFPNYRRSLGYDEAISLSPDLRAEVEADVIAAYKAAKANPQNKWSEKLL